MKARNIFYTILKLLFLPVILSLIYFIGFTFVENLISNTVWIIFFVKDMVLISLKFFNIFYSNFEVYFVEELIGVRAALFSPFRNVYNELNFSKLWIEWYFYSKFIYGGIMLNADINYVIRPDYWGFSVWDLTHSNKSKIVDALLYKNGALLSDNPSVKFLDYYWGSYRWNVTEGDLHLMPGEYYKPTVKRFIKRFFRFTVWMSGVYLYLPSWTFYENFFHENLYSALNISLIYLNYIVFRILKYKSLITLFLFFLVSRFIINVGFLTKYISGYVHTKNIFVLNRFYSKSIVFLFLVIFLSVTVKSTFIWILLFFLESCYFAFYMYFILSKSWDFWLFSNKLSSKLLMFILSVRAEVDLLKDSKRNFDKITKAKRKSNKAVSVIEDTTNNFHKNNYVILRARYKKLIYLIIRFNYLLKNMFRYYFPYFYYYYFDMRKPLKKLIRWQVYYNSSDNVITPSLVNPLRYTEMSIPVVLKGSRGGLWVRTTNRTYAKHLMYENKNALWFFKHKDAYRIWESSYEFGIHLYDQRELMYLNSDKFFTNFFSGAIGVFSGLTNKAQAIGGVSHYDIYHKFMASSDIHTYMRLRRLALLQRSISLIFYRIYMRLAPKVVSLAYLAHTYILNKSILFSYFFSGLLRAQVEFTSFNVDPEYMPYLRFIEFYKLPGYLFFDYYLTRKFPQLAVDNRRHYQVFSFKELDGWIMRYKFFELKPEAYFVINGGLQRGVMSFSPILVMKLAKWTMLFYRHVPVEYLIFVFISFLSNIWIFNKVFVIFDTYIYRCMYPSIWAKKKFILNNTRLRFHHGMLRSRWLRNREFMGRLKRGKYIHTRYNTFGDSDLF